MATQPNLSQRDFENQVRELLSIFPNDYKYRGTDGDWVTVEQTLPRVLDLKRRYDDSRKTETPLAPNVDYVRLLARTAYALHDNDTTRVVSTLLSAAKDTYHFLPESERDDTRVLTFINAVYGLHYQSTSQFRASEAVLQSVLHDLNSCNPQDGSSNRSPGLKPLIKTWLSMAVASQPDRLQEGLEILLSAHRDTQNPRYLDKGQNAAAWAFNLSRNHYCLGHFTDAETVLLPAAKEVLEKGDWYPAVYAHVTLASLYARQGKLDAARQQVELGRRVLERSAKKNHLGGKSWVAGLLAYRAGDVALRMGQVNEAVTRFEESISIGSRNNAPEGIMARYHHGLARALSKSEDRKGDAETHAIQARKFRTAMAEKPRGISDDDQSDEAFELCVKIDQR